MDCYDILVSQKKKLEPFFHNLNTEKMNQLGQFLVQLPPSTNIFIYGIGKSENLAIHFASILNSISIKAFPASPQNCLHGDIGYISSQDWLILLSNSGNTRELLDLAPFLYNKTTNIIGVFSNPNAKLLQYCHPDYSIILPKVFELDRFNQIPSTSVLEFTLFINILTSYIIEQRNMKLEEYANNHPNGEIGKRIYKRVKDIMIPREKIAIVKSDTSIKDCLFKICEKHLRCAIVLDANDRLLGIATDGNLRRYLANDDVSLSDSISNCLNLEPFIVNEYDRISEIIDDIKKDYRLLSGIPVINEENHLVGLISQHQIVDYGM